MVKAYTDEQTKEMLEIYGNEPTKDTVKMLAEKYGKSEKSVIGKLSKEGVYRKEVYLSKTGELPITKVDLVAELEEILGVEGLEGLEKSPKLVLKKLVETARQRVKQV